MATICGQCFTFKFYKIHGEMEIFVMVRTKFS